MIEVSKEVFYAAMGPQNVHPRPERLHCEWVHCETGVMLGKSEPGWKSPHGTPGRYFMIERLVPVVNTTQGE